MSVLSAYRAYETSSEGLQLVASAELFRGEVAEALSVKIAKFEAEDQQAVITELRTHEQVLVGWG